MLKWLTVTHFCNLLSPFEMFWSFSKGNEISNTVPRKSKLPVSLRFLPYAIHIAHYAICLVCYAKCVTQESPRHKCV